MPGQHRPGYDAAHKADQREANRLLRQAHPDEWQQYFDAARARRRTNAGGDR